MSSDPQTVSIDRMKHGGPSRFYVFWLIASCLQHDEEQTCLYVDPYCRELTYKPATNPSLSMRQNVSAISRTSLNTRFDFSTVEHVIHSLTLFHHDFLIKHGITIEMDITPIESTGLPEGVAE